MRKNNYIPYNQKRRVQNDKVVKYQEYIARSDSEPSKTVTIEKNPPPSPQNENNAIKKKRIKNILIIIAIIIGLGIIIGIAMYFYKKPKKDTPDELKATDKNQDNIIEDTKDENIKDTTQPEKQINNFIVKEEIKKAFENNFKIVSKEDTLTQLLLKSTQNYNTKTDGKESSYSIFTKAKYDIYTINGTSSGEDSDFYSTKYTTTIAINSYCTQFSSSSSEEDCELEELLNFNYRDTNNLRRNDEEDPYEIIKEAILPLCIIEHTDSNLIISVTCPETLADNLKNDIILAFKTIKPDSAKGLNYDEDLAGTKIEKKDNKVYIKSFLKGCEDFDGDPNKNINCEVDNDIVTDNDGNLISSKKISNYETIIDENNKFSKNLKYIFEDISQKNANEFNPENYKLNLNTFFDLTKSFMHKENYISKGDFYDLAEVLSSNENETTVENNLRYLHEEINEEQEEQGVHEENIFSKTIYNVTMDFNIKNDIGLGEGQSAKAISNYNYNKGNQSQDLSYYQLDTNLNETLNKFVILSKSGNKLANMLSEKLNGPLNDLRDIINENINELNNYLAFEDLSKIFDSTYAVNEVEKLPFKFVAASENLYSYLNELNNDVLYKINDIRNILKNEIQNFLTNSHNLLFQIFDNLEEASNALSSTKNKIAEISSYYLNHTDTSYIDLIQEAKDILDNYYINEINKIVPLFNDILIESNQNSIQSVEKEQLILDNIVDNLENGKTTIVLANNEDIQNVIRNIYNSKIKTNDFINNVENGFRDSLNIKSNGYFESQSEINNNKQSYKQISERALNIAYTLDNNELIDTTFDNYMIYFRDQFMTMLNYIDNSKYMNFPLREDVLGSSLFNITFTNEINNFFKEEKKKISKFINDENNNYFKSINDILDSFKNKSNQNIDQIIENLKNDISDLILINLDDLFNKTFIVTKNKIDKIIDNNNKKAVEYLTNAIRSGSTHRTKAFINKYNTYINSLNQIRNFIKLNLKNNLSIKYKTIIDEIRSLLQSIKSNPTLNKYYSQLPFAERHISEILKLFTTFESHISDELFNTNYLPNITNYINSRLDNLDKIEKNIKNLFNSFASLTYSSSNNYDIYHYIPNCHRCCKFKLGRCWKHYTCCNPYYQGYVVSGTNNHVQLESINFSEYYLEFDNKYIEISSKFSNDIKLYNSLLSDLNQEIDNKTEEIFNKDTNSNYLNDISNKIANIINDKLGNTLLISSYNYYKNYLNNKLPNELNNILTQWKNIYDDIYEKLNVNKNKFKSSLIEFLYTASFYSQMIENNITYEYGDFIVDKYKNEFNYTIKYYYHLIESTVKQAYSYIFNNMPLPQKPFDEILNIRINEINNSYNNILTEIQNSKNEILQEDNQLRILKVNKKNFFLINDYISQNIDDVEEQLEEKVEEISSLIEEEMEDTSEELIVARFYLENAQSGKQIKENYANIDKPTFIDLQYDVYQDLIKKTCKVDTYDIIKNIKSFLKNSKEYIESNFKLKIEEYKKILEEKIENELFTKDNLIKEINNIYSNGLNYLNPNYKEEIYGYIYEILNIIKSHIESEVIELNYKLESYSKNYTIIEGTMNDYKKTIYEQFDSTITSVIHNFYNNILTKFHKNYIEENIDIFQNNANKEKFDNKQFYSTSLNLSYTIIENLTALISDYKRISKNQIDVLYQIHLQELDKILSFSDMKQIIDNEINNLYYQKLLPVLNATAIYNSGDVNIKDYNLNKTSLDEINNIIKEKIEQVKNISEKEIKGSNYNINYNWKTPTFTDAKRNEFSEIKTLFDNFTKSFSDEDELIKTINENIKNNFENMVNNFVPFFGKDFFDRILKYNGFQKIKGLYSNLKYSLGQTVLYYVGLSVLYTGQVALPKDISLKIITLNNLESIIKKNNEDLISSINKKLIQFCNETKNYLVDEYIKNITNDQYILTELGDEIKEIITGNAISYRNVSEAIYLNAMDTYINIPFLEEIKKILKEQENDMYYFIKERKEELKVESEDLFIIDSDEILANINNKLNNTRNAINSYNNYFDSYKNISKDVKNFLLNYGKDLIWPKYQDIKDLIDEYTLETVIENLDKYSNIYKNEYSIANFENKTDSINSNFSEYIDSMNQSLKDYGIIKEKYSFNLEREISNSSRIRRLEDTNEEKMLYNQQIADIKIDKTFQELKNNSISIIQFLESLSYFYNFDEKIEKYTKELASQVKYSEYVLNRNKQKNNNYDKMMRRLRELQRVGENYYLEANKSYYKMKELIFNETNGINELIDICTDITFNTIAENYNQYKNSFTPIKNIYNKEKEDININYEDGNNYFAIAHIKNYLIENEISLDIIFEDNDIKKPKVIGKIINNISPKNFIIDFYSKSGQKYGRIGREINLLFNNISSCSIINFDARLNKAILNTDFNFGDYTIKTNFYQQKEVKNSKPIVGGNYKIPSTSKKEYIDPPENEAVSEDIPSKKSNKYEEYIF